MYLYKKDAHGFADNLTCPEIFIRLDSESKQSNYTIALSANKCARIHWSFCSCGNVCTSRFWRVNHRFVEAKYGYQDIEVWQNIGNNSLLRGLLRAGTRLWTPNSASSLKTKQLQKPIQPGHKKKESADSNGCRNCAKYGSMKKLDLWTCILVLWVCFVL